MAQPYDYSRASSRINPIQVAQGLQGLKSGAQQLEMQKQQLEKMGQYEDQLQGLRGITGAEGFSYADPAQVGALQQQFPEQIDEIQRQQQFALGQQDVSTQQQQQLTDEQNRDINKAANSLLLASSTGRPDLVDRAIENNRGLIDNTGDGAITADVLKEIYQEDPEKFNNMMNRVVSQTGQEGEVITQKDRETFSLEREKLDQREREALVREKQQEISRETNALRAEKLQEELKGLEKDRDNFGFLSPKVGTEITNDMSLDEVSYNGLSRALNILYDGEESGVSLKGSRIASFVNSFRELGGFDPNLDAQFADAYGTAALDLARQLAQVLRPVSGEQLQLVLRSLQGGNWGQAIQSIRGTMNQTEESYAGKRNNLIRNEAGIADRWPEALEFKRYKNILESEEQRYARNPSATPGAEDDAAVAGAGGQAPPTQPGTVQPPQQPPQPGQTEAPRPFAQTSDDDLARSLGITLSPGRRLSNIQIGDY